MGETPVELVNDFQAAAGAANGIINATPVGMEKLPGTPIPVELLQPDHWVIDIIYFPMETEFLRAARERDCHALSGAGMAIHQAVRYLPFSPGWNPIRNG